MTSGLGGVIETFSKRERCQKNGVRKMRVRRFAPNRGAGCFMFLTGIFLTSSPRKIGNGFCADPKLAGPSRMQSVTKAEKAGRVPTHRDPPRRARSARPTCSDRRITLSRAAVGSLRTQPEQRQQIRHLHQSFRLASFLCGKLLAGILFVQQLLKTLLHASRQPESRQIAGHLNPRMSF